MATTARRSWRRPTTTGVTSPTWPRAAESKTVSPSGTTVGAPPCPLLSSPSLTGPHAGRKLRNRLEELERQAGGEPTTTASASKPAGAAKRTKTTSASSAPGAYSNVNPSNPSSSNNYGQANAGPSNTYYGSDSLDDDLLDLSPLARGSVSPQSADSTESLPFSRTNSDASTPNNGLNLHSGDFGPLLLDVRGPRRVPSMTATPQQQYTEAQSQSRALALSPSPVPELTQASTMSMAGSPPNAGVVGSWQPNDPSNYSKMLSNLVTLEYPQPGPGYSASPIHNPNPLHLNAPLPRDEFYISVPYTKLVAATMTIGRMLKMNENMVCDDDMVSTLTPEVVPEEAIDLKPTALQSRVPHHPYIDLLPFPGYRDRLLAVAMRGAATGDWELESRLCRAMNESWAVWGECPWMAESWEVGEDFARYVPTTQSEQLSGQLGSPTQFCPSPAFSQAS